MTSLGGGAITPQFVFDLESRMRIIQANEYQRLLGNLWYTKVVKEIPSASRRELMFWLLDTATIERAAEGSIDFEELVMNQTEFEPKFASKGLRVVKSKFEDLDGGGVNLAAAWARQMGAQMAYWPQAEAASALINGTSNLGYDGQAFFSAAHPLNPFDSALGTYKNLWTDNTSTGGSLGVKLDDRHSLDTCFKSFAEIRAAIAKIKMPNGTQPRMLRPLFFIAPPRMMDRLAVLTSAKYVGLDSSSGSTDIADMRVIARWGLQPPVEAEELSAAFGGSDTDCYLVTQQITDQELGGLVYVNREPFAIRYYSGDSSDGAAVGLDAVLNRARELEWHVQGRNVLGYGHPYLIHKLVGQAA
jgi:hypothetical protein